MRDPTELLNHIALKTMELKVSNREGGWRWRAGITLFSFPEARCPSCEQWIQTNRVWLVDEKNFKLLFCWHKDGTIVDQNKEVVHPHVNNAKRICRGSNNNPADALFAGISEGHHYQNTEVFFWQLGHDCPNVPKETCRICNGRFVNIGIFSFGDESMPLCSHYCSIVANMFRCWGCFGETLLDGNSDRDGYCETCYIANSLPCGLCERRVLTYNARRLPTEEVVCTHCYPNHFSRCSNCLREHHNSLINEDGRCERCSRRTYYCICDCECRNEVDDEDTYCDDCNEGH